jgi:hypothetical protein
MAFVNCQEKNLRKVREIPSVPVDPAEYLYVKEIITYKGHGKGLVETEVSPNDVSAAEA